MTHWVGGWAKKSVFITNCIAKSTVTLHFPALCRAKYFPPVKIFWIYLSSFQVFRQCSPVQIKYVSFADKIICFSGTPDGGISMKYVKCSIKVLTIRCMFSKNVYNKETLIVDQQLWLLFNMFNMFNI